jgi:hypothetical protein
MPLPNRRMNSPKLSRRSPNAARGGNPSRAFFDSNFMKALSITGRNVKGRDFSYALEKVNVITGCDNFRGKTTILETIRVCLIGYLPRLGKQPSATMTLAGEDRQDMEMIMNFENDLVIKHTWKRKKDGATYDGEIPQALATPIVLLDPNYDYFSKTAAERINSIMSRITFGEEFSDAAILERLQKIEVIPAALSQKASKEMLSLVQESIKNRSSTKELPQAWMESLTAKFTEEQKANKQFKDQQSKQLQGIKATQPTVPPKDTSKELQEKQNRLAIITAELTAGSTLIATQNKNEARIAELTAIKNSTPEDPAPLRARLADLETTISTQKNILASGEIESGKLRERRQKAVGNRNAKNEELESVKKQLDDLAKALACPFCRSNAPGWSQIVSDHLAAEIARISSETARLADEIKVIDQEGLKIKGRLDQIRQENQDRELTKGEWLHDLKIMDAAITAKQTAETELSILQKAVDLPDPNHLASLEAEKNTINLAITELTSKTNIFNQYASNNALMRSTESKMLEYQAFEEFYKKAGAEMLAIQKEFVTTAFGSLLEKALCVTHDILLAPLEFKNGDLGMMSKSGWVSHKVFSGAEESIAYAAFSVALAQTAPCKIVLIDEMDRIQQPRRKLLIDRMIELTDKGVIDQFVGVTSDPSIYDPKKVNIITVE